MAVAARALLGASVVACVLSCTGPSDPMLRAMEKAVRVQIGASARPVVGYLRDTTGLLIDFDAAVLHDTLAAAFERTARAVALAAMRVYPRAAAVGTVLVSAGQPIGERSLRVLRQCVFTGAELRTR